MFGIGKVGTSLVGPGAITGPGAPTVFAEASIVSTANDTIATHGENKHAAATVLLPTCSKTVFAMSKPVTMNQQSTGSCLHPVTLGAITVKVGL